MKIRSEEQANTTQKKCLDAGAGSLQGDEPSWRISRKPLPQTFVDSNVFGAGSDTGGGSNGPALKNLPR